MLRMGYFHTNLISKYDKINIKVKTSKIKISFQQRCKTPRQVIKQWNPVTYKTENALWSNQHSLQECNHHGYSTVITQSTIAL